ncbi:MAG TPA: PAS domain S-box protein [Candidatus Aquabacterium excrementipullorum]|nr:PAS domain S-box protein [Candidatus Aquabacterium excrementipullorum]
MLSVDGNIVSWNAGAQRFKGYAAEEIVGQHFSRFYTEEDKASGIPERALLQAARDGKFEAEGWRVRKDGTRFWASVVIDAVRNERSELIGFAKITRDITDKKQAELALHESEQRFRLLVEGVTDYAIYMLSPEGLITNWNAGAKNIKGYEAHEVIGTSFSRFYSAEDQQEGKPQAALQAAKAHGRFESEGWRFRKDGSRFFAHVVIDAIKNDMGELVGFAKITRDITERKAAQAELEKAREALYQAQKMEAMGKVTGGIAHDFNNLLSVVTNGLVLLRRNASRDTDIRLIDTMERAAQRGGTLIQQLLAFARQQPLQKEHQNLTRLIDSFEAVLRRAGRSTTKLDFELAPDLPSVLIDVAQVETGLLNLVVNAYDATPPHGRIVVTTKLVELRDKQVQKLPAGRYVTLSVRDDGHGMPADVATKAIEPFFTTKEVGKGTGLGLSQVYGIAQQSGGDLVIQSKEGEGTTITLYFPASELDSASDTEQADIETVLIVDDQVEVLEMTAELFRSLGFDVLSATSGQHALNILQRSPHVSLLFSDVVMNDMNGIELAKRASAAYPALRVILSSGYAGHGTAVPTHGKLEGFHFLAKPYRVNEVVRKLRAIG